MLPRERSEFSAIVDRPPLKLPGNNRIVIWTIVNYEVWDIGKPMARQVIPAPTGQPMLPDVPNWSWHEYGMRVGCWRFFNLLQAARYSADAVDQCARLRGLSARRRRSARQWLGVHGLTPMSRVRSTRSRTRKAMINRSMDVIEKFTGKRPVGWLGPGLTQTLETPELLVDAGVKYIGDWVYDDEPTVINTAKGPLVTLPYTVELNDIPMMIVQHHESDHLYKRAVETFNQLYEEGKDRVKIMAIAVHPYISGQPFRIKPLADIYDYVNRFEGVLHWNGEQILDWYKSVNPTIGGSK